LLLLYYYFEGFASEGNTDAVGEPDNGHASLARPRHGAPFGGAAQAQTLRSNEAAHISQHDEEHHRSRHLSTDRCTSDTVCRSGHAIYQLTVVLVILFAGQVTPSIN